MVNNSTNIKKKTKKTNNHLSLSSHLKGKDQDIWHWKNHFLAWDRHNKVAWLKSLFIQFSVLCFVDPCLSLFVVIVLSVLRFTASDYLFGIFKNVLLTALIILLLWSFITNLYHFGLVVCLGKLNNNKCVYIYSLLIYKYKQIGEYF